MIKRVLHCFLLLYIIYNLNGQTISSYTSQNSDLPGDIVKAVFVDEFGNKWFGTNNGLAMFNGDLWIIYTDESDHAIADNTVNDVDYQLDNIQGSELWLGTINGVTVAAFGIDGITAATSYHSGSGGVSLVSNMINAVAVDYKGTRYFGTDDGLAVYDESTWLYFDENTEPDIPDLEILSIDADDDSIYIGLSGDSFVNAEGVARIQNTVDGFTGATPYVMPYNIPSGKVFEVFVDSEGYRWFGTDYGIVRHTGIIGKDYGKDMLISSENGLAGDSVYAINEDPEKNMWFGTDHGVSKMNTSGGLTNFNTDDGLVNNKVYDIDFDLSNGTVWFATEGGVSYMENGFVNIPVQKLKSEALISIIPSVISESAEIKINMPVKGYVELAIYNPSGQKINTLFRGYMNQGEQVIILNANPGKFKQGIYILRLEMQNNIMTKKIIIL